MKTTFKKISEIIEDEKNSKNGCVSESPCPIPLKIIPKYMGISLCSVDGISWQEQDDEQLTSLTIYFIPKK